MKDGSPFAAAGIWESWEHLETKKIIRTFAIITTKANELVGTIHDRMPVIIAPADYHRWLSPIGPDPNDMMKPYPSEPMTIWPNAREFAGERQSGHSRSGRSVTQEVYHADGRLRCVSLRDKEQNVN